MSYRFWNAILWIASVITAISLFICWFILPEPTWLLAIPIIAALVMLFASAAADEAADREFYARMARRG